MKKENAARIALMLPRFSRYGGVEQFGYQLAEALCRAGHNVDFICSRQETPAPEGVRIRNVGRIGGVRALKMLWFLIRAEQLRQREQYDLTVSLGKTWNQDITRVGGGPLQVFWRLSELAWPAGAPRALKRFARLIQPANWLTLLIEKRMFTRTPCIVAISDAVRGWVEEAYPHLAKGAPFAGGPVQTVRTIYNCPDVSRFHPPLPHEKLTAKDRFKVKAGTYALGLATTNFALKGVAQLIDALVLLPGDTHLHVAGGRNPGVYRDRARRAGVEGRVHFHGKVDDMQSFYHALDMFVLPTFYDTLGNVVLEALGSGLPVICSDRAGAAAFLPEGQVLRRPEDPAAIARMVEALRRAEKPVASLEPKGAGIEEMIALIEEELRKKREA